MIEYLVILRIVHIVGGVFWAGTLGFQAWYIIPAVKALGPDGSKFSQQLTKTRRFPLVMAIVAGLTTLSGILMMAKLSNGFQSAWFDSYYAKTLSIGGVLAIVAYTIGLSVNIPSITRMTAIGRAAAAAGGPPSPEQMTQLQRLRKRLFRAVQIIAVLLFLAVACMSTAQYMDALIYSLQ